MSRRKFGFPARVKAVSPSFSPVDCFFHESLLPVNIFPRELIGSESGCEKQRRLFELRDELLLFFATNGHEFQQLLDNEKFVLHVAATPLEPLQGWVA